MSRRPAAGAVFVGALVLVTLAGGCAPRGTEPDGHVPPLHPVRGQVLLGTGPAAGGSLSFSPEPPMADVVIQAEVGLDGRFEVTTVDTRNPQGARAPGAPEGNYRVAYMPADAARGHGGVPVRVPEAVRVSAGPNDVTIRLPGPAR